MKTERDKKIKRKLRTNREQRKRSKKNTKDFLNVLHQTKKGLKKEF